MHILQSLSIDYTDKHYIIISGSVSRKESIVSNDLICCSVFICLHVARGNTTKCYCIFYGYSTYSGHGKLSDKIHVLYEVNIKSPFSGNSNLTCLLSIFSD